MDEKKMSPFTDKYGELATNIMLNIAEILCLQLPEGHDRVVAAKWVKKFQICQPAEFKHYLKLFISCLTKKVLVEPFDKAPVDYQSNQWQAFSKEYTLQDINEAMIKEFYREALAPPYDIEVSKDLKEYVAYQEIPAFGAHFYFAFSPSEQIDDWSNFQRLNIPKSLVQDLNTSAAKMIQDENIRMAVMINERTQRDKHDLVSPLKLRTRNVPPQAQLKAPARVPGGAIPRATQKRKTKKKPEWTGPLPSPERQKTPPKRGMDTIAFGGKAPGQVPSNLQHLLTGKRKAGESSRRVTAGSSRSPIPAQIKSPRREKTPPRSPKTPPRQKTPDWRKTPPGTSEKEARFFRFRRDTQGASEDDLRQFHHKVRARSMNEQSPLALAGNIADVAQQINEVSRAKTPNLATVDVLTKSVKAIGQMQSSFVRTSLLIDLEEKAEALHRGLEEVQGIANESGETEVANKSLDLMAEAVHCWITVDNEFNNEYRKSINRIDIQEQELINLSHEIAGVRPETEADAINLIDFNDTLSEKFQEGVQKMERMQRFLKNQDAIDRNEAVAELTTNLDLLTGDAIASISVPILTPIVQSRLRKILEKSQENVDTQIQMEESIMEPKSPASPYFNRHNVTIIDNETIMDISAGILELSDGAIDLVERTEENLRQSFEEAENEEQRQDLHEKIEKIQNLNQSFKAVNRSLADLVQQKQFEEEEDDLDLTEAPQFASP